MKKTILFLTIVCSALSAQTWRGKTSGYVFFSFNGNGQPGGPNIFTTAWSADGLTNWENTGGRYYNYWSQINGSDTIYFNGKYYIENFAPNDQNLLLTTWQIGQINETNGLVTPVSAIINWSGAVSGAVSCFSGVFVRNANMTAYTADGYVHMLVPCATSGSLNNFQGYETHSSDMVTWSPPVAFTVTGQTNVDDFHVYLIGSTFEMFVKNETSAYEEIATSSALLGPYTVVKSGDWAGWGSNLEGAFPYHLGISPDWYMQVERFSNAATTAPIIYYSFCNTSDFLTCTWTALTAYTEDYIYRHGAVVELEPR